MKCGYVIVFERREMGNLYVNVTVFSKDMDLWHGILVCFNYK